MRRELLIAAGPGEWRAALLEDGVVVELHAERGDRREAGSLHLGRVARLAPALGAALVDIGDARPAFLPFSELLGSGRPAEGARVLVQVRREALGGKAARVTMRPLLRGGLVELRIGRPGLLGGEDLSAAERRRLAAAAGEAAGLRILEPASAEALAAEAAALRRRWQDIEALAAGSEPPARLDPLHNRAAALAAALPTPPDAVIADEPAALPEIRAAFPAAEIRRQAAQDWPIDLDALFDAALAPTLALDGGGAVHVEPTRAGTMIDVDSGTPETGSPEASAAAIDLAAAAAIARQLRLRNLGGAIFVDFIGLDQRGQRARLRAALAEALAADPAGPRILGWSRLGHLEIVRPRRAPPLAERLLVPAAGGAFVKSPPTLAYEALRLAARHARAEPHRRWRLAASPAVAAALAGEAAEARRALEAGLGWPIAVVAEPGCERFQILPA